MSEMTDMEPSEPGARQPPPRIYYYALGLTLACVAYFLLAASQMSRLNQAMGLALFVLCALPTLSWCRSAGRSIPIFAILGLANLAVYALPILRSNEQILQYQDETITRAVSTVLLLQACMLVGNHFTRARPGSNRFFTESLIDEKVHRFLLGALLLSTAYAYVSSMNDFIPYGISGPVRAICMGLGMISVFYLCSRMGDGSIGHGERIILISCIILQILFNCSSLMIVSSISLFVLAVTGYVSGGKRLPVLALALGIPIFALLHNGKHVLREKYWDQATGIRTTPTLSQLPGFYVEWTRAGLLPRPAGNAEKQPGLAAGLLDRTSMLQMLCLVTDCTPYRQPYLSGETYADIPGQFIPRFFWQNKPGAHVSTTRLSVYYGLQEEDSTNWTTIGFGLAAEAYANFGFLGISGLGLFLGFLYKQVSERTRESPMFSGAGLVVVMFAAWSFQTEFTMSIWLVSLVQACITAILFPLAIRKFFG